MQFWVYDEVVSRMKRAYAQIESRIGDPLDTNTLVGPMHTKESVKDYEDAVAEAISSVILLCSKSCGLSWFSEYDVL